MASEDLEAQVEREWKEIQDAPKVPVSQLQPRTAGQAGRCSWCGQWSSDVVYVDTFHKVDRYKGVTCCGGRHV